jgi:hypothetical protein
MSKFQVKSQKKVHFCKGTSKRFQKIVVNIILKPNPKPEQSRATKVFKNERFTWAAENGLYLNPEKS